MKKTIDPSSLFLNFLFCLVVGGIVYLITMFLAENSAKINYSMSFLAGVELWVVFLALKAIFTKEMNGYYYQHNNYTRFYSGVGYAFLLGLMASIPALIALGMDASMEFTSKTRTVIFFNLVLLTYVSACLCTFWSHYTVKKDTIVHHYGKILFPEDRYIVLPIQQSSTRVMARKVGIILKLKKLECLDGSLDLNINTIVTMEIEKAKEAKLNHFDLDYFQSRIDQKIADLVIKYAKKTSRLDFLLRKLPEAELECAGMHLSWKGNILFSGFNNERNLIE